MIFLANRTINLGSANKNVRQLHERKRIGPCLKIDQCKIELQLPLQPFPSFVPPSSLAPTPPFQLPSASREIRVQDEAIARLSGSQVRNGIIHPAHRKVLHLRLDFMSISKLQHV